MMLTLDQVAAYAERVIAEYTLAGDQQALKNTQRALGFLVTAAEAQADHETARRFRILAAQAANKAEEISGDR
jgi:hypothetical protein